jgi:hypothetical protein
MEHLHITVRLLIVEPRARPLILLILARFDFDNTNIAKERSYRLYL